MNLETTRLRGSPRNRWQDEVREDVKIVGGEGWQEKVYNREEWKKLLRTARNSRILHMPMERMKIKSLGYDTKHVLTFWRSVLHPSSGPKVSKKSVIRNN
jgi:hypothetical protein